MVSYPEVEAACQLYNKEWLLPIISYYWNYFQWVAWCWIEAGFTIKEALESFAEASQWWQEVWND